MIIVPQNISHKVSTTFLLNLRSTVDSFHRGEGLKHALVAVGKVDDHNHICPHSVQSQLNAVGKGRCGKKSSRSYNFPKPFGTLKSRKKFEKIGSKRTNQRVRSFGRIRIRISDPRSLRSWRTKGTELLFVDSVTMTIGAKSVKTT